MTVMIKSWRFGQPYIARLCVLLLLTPAGGFAADPPQSTGPAVDALLPRDLSMRRIRSPFWAAIPVWLGALAPIGVFLIFAWRGRGQDELVVQ